MHQSEREQRILELMRARGFVSFKELQAKLDASAATIRRDLERLSEVGQILRVRGGARLTERPAHSSGGFATQHLAGVPFWENVGRHAAQKAAIGKAAAALCNPGEGVMIDGGSTTLQMCSHLAGLNLQVLTNSLHIVSALLPQSGTRILVPSGAVFREQDIILAAAGEESMPRFHAPKLFMGAASIGPQGPMQADVVLVAAERRLIARADRIILLVDSSKFESSSGNVVCAVDEIDTIVTDRGIKDEHRRLVEGAGVEIIIAD